MANQLCYQSHSDFTIYPARVNTYSNPEEWSYEETYIIVKLPITANGGEIRGIYNKDRIADYLYPGPHAGLYRADWPDILEEVLDRLRVVTSSIGDLTANLGVSVFETDYRTFAVQSRLRWRLLKRPLRYR